MSKFRNPGTLAEFDQMKASATGHLDRLRILIRELAADGHDEMCLTSCTYVSIIEEIKSNVDVHQMAKMLAFALVREADVPNKDQVGCVH